MKYWPGEDSDVRRKLGSWFQERGIETCVFDFDNTFVLTNEAYEEKMREFCEFIVRRTSLEVDVETVFEEMCEIDVALRPEVSVGPGWVPVATKTLAGKYFVDEDEEYQEYYEGVLSVYMSTPKQYPGARENAEMIESTGVSMKILTHASLDWTMKKIWSLGWGGMFDGVFCVPIHLWKDASQWRKGFEQMGVYPENAMVVGDSINSDIKPAIEVGVNTVVWVKNNSGNEAPKGVITIEGVGGLVEGLLSKA